MDLAAPVEEQVEAVRRTRRMALGFYATALFARLEHGSVPLVVTVSSFVALGADVVGIDLDAEGTVLTLREPGPWFADLSAARLWSGPGAERRWLVLPRGESGAPSVATA